MIELSANRAVVTAPVGLAARNIRAKSFPPGGSIPKQRPLGREIHGGVMEKYNAHFFSRKQHGGAHGCLKSFARKKSQDPGIIELKSCDSAKVCYTGPKVATPSIVQGCSEPVKEARGEGSRPAGQGHQAAQDLAGQLEGRKVTSSNRVSTPEGPAVTSRAETAAAVKKSKKCRVYVKIDINVKYKRSDEIFKKFRHLAKNSWQQADDESGLGIWCYVTFGGSTISKVLCWWKALKHL